MHKFKIEYTLRDPRYMVMVEMDRERLTSRDFKTIVNILFMTACDGIDYDHMKVSVYRDGEHLFDMRSEVEVDGSRIDCYVSIDGQFYRVMNIAS